MATFCGMLRRVVQRLLKAETAGEKAALQSLMCDCKLMDALMWCVAMPMVCGCQSGRGELPPALKVPEMLICTALARIIEGHVQNQSQMARRTYATAWLFPSLAAEAGEVRSLGAKLQGAGNEPFWADTGQGRNRVGGHAAWLTTVVSLLPWRTHGAVVFRCAVANNLGAIMKHVSKSMLHQIVRFLQERGPRPDWLELLGSVCVCLGQSVPQQQDAILRTLLSAKSFEGEFEAGSELTRHRIFLETVCSDDRAQLKFYAPKSDLADLDRLLGTDAVQDRDKAQAEAWESIVGVDDLNRRLSIVIALSDACVIDKKWLAPGGLFPRGVKPHKKGDTATTKRGRNQRTYVDGPRFYEAATVEGLQHFEEALRDGTAHIDRGYNFLGKQMFMQGIPQLLVSLNRKTGIMGGGIENRSGDGPLLRCSNVCSDFELPDELLRYHAAVRYARPQADVSTKDLQWVPLEELCWVLDPTRLHAKVFRGKGVPFNGVKSLVGESLERFKRQKLFARWYEAQLKLLAMMSFGENTRCAPVLQQLMPFETCFCGMWNRLLPNEIRTAFTELVTNLYVAATPHRVVRLPQRVRRYVQLREDPDLLNEIQQALPQASPENMRRLRLLKWLAADFFTMDPRQIIGNLSRTKLEQSMLQLQRTLVDFGFYGTELDIRIFLCDPLLKVMDGRTDDHRTLTADHGGVDLTNADDHNVEAPEPGPGEPGGRPWVPTDRYTVTAFTAPVIQCKGYICHTLLKVAALRVDYRLSKLLHAWWVLDNSAARKKHQMRAEAEAVLESAPKGRTVKELLAAKKAAKIMKASVHPGTSEVVPTLTRDGPREPQDARSIIGDYGQTSSLLRILDVFAASNDAEGPDANMMYDQLFTRVFCNENAKVPTLEFEPMTTGKFVTTILDLLMYEDHDTFEAAMQLLVRNFESRRCLRALLNDVQLVKNTDVMAKTVEIESDVLLLDTLLSTFPVCVARLLRRMRSIPLPMMLLFTHSHQSMFCANARSQVVDGQLPAPWTWAARGMPPRKTCEDDKVPATSHCSLN